MSKIVIEGDGTEIRNCKFTFKCPKFWGELQGAEYSRIRHCNSCNEDVYRCTTDEDIADAIKRNRCVAIMPYFDESAQWQGGLIGRIDRA